MPRSHLDLANARSSRRQQCSSLLGYTQPQELRVCPCVILHVAPHKLLLSMA